MRKVLKTVLIIIAIYIIFVAVFALLRELDGTAARERKCIAECIESGTDEDVCVLSICDFII